MIKVCLSLSVFICQRVLKMTPADVTYCVFRQLVICNMGFLILSRLKPKVIPQQLPAYEIKGKELLM